MPLPLLRVSLRLAIVDMHQLAAAYAQFMPDIAACHSLQPSLLHPLCCHSS